MSLLRTTFKIPSVRAQKYLNSFKKWHTHTHTHIPTHTHTHTQTHTHTHTHTYTNTYTHTYTHTVLMEAEGFSETLVLYQIHGITNQKTVIFRRTSGLTRCLSSLHDAYHPQKS
jgi:hypothetical protein